MIATRSATVYVAFCLIPLQFGAVAYDGSVGARN